MNIFNQSKTSLSLIVELVLIYLCPCFFFLQISDAAARETYSDIEIHAIKENREIKLFAENISSFPITMQITIRPNEIFTIKNILKEPTTLMPGGRLQTTLIIAVRPEISKNDIIMDVDEIPGGLSVNEDHVYSLPCSCQTECKLSNDNSEFEHEQWARHSLDFDMPLGSDVLAVREGTVIEVVETSDQRCDQLSPQCNSLTNRVIILAEDGSFAEYLHLMKDGALVNVGDVVHAGQLIAYSGNTGFSSGPHLHLNVIKAQKDFTQVTVPMRFNTTKGVTKIEMGSTYISPRCAE